jgi:hypothetical protein
MRKMLLGLPLLALAFSFAPAAAADIEGGDLIVQGEFPASIGGVLGPDALTGAYSNITTFTGSVFNNGGTANQGGNLITRLVADDLVPNPIYGGVDVVSFTFAVANLNGVQVSFRPRVRFWFADGVLGAPGTYYNIPGPIGFTFNAIALGAGTVTLLTASLGPGVFSMPGVPFWAGITFDNNLGATGATLAQMDLLGVGLFDPPTVGSSADLMFQTTAAGSFFAPNNPAGGTFNFGGTPVASVGWDFTVDDATPAATTSWGRLKSLYR